MGFIVRRIGRTFTALIVISALLMCVPGIVMISLSSTIYGKPLTEPGQALGTTIGASTTINLEGFMTQGNSYDIHVEITVFATPANPPSSEVTIRMTIQTSGVDIATLPPTHDFNRLNFNSTIISETYEFEDDFASSASANFSFEIIDSVNLTSAYIQISLHENPRRVLANIAMIVGLVLLIPGGLILIGAACLFGRKR